MARLIELYNQDKRIQAEVAPDNGGMITQIWVEGREILHLDRTALELHPMAAGGNPILFPFPSKTKDDSYELNGVRYGMPMHGLIKNAAFGVEAMAEDQITLWIESNPCWCRSQYPFAFRFTVTYRVCENCVRLLAHISNLSGSPMPHYFGWHPFFKASDKTKITLEHHMKMHYDHINCVDGPAPAEMNLTKKLDDVFHTPELNEFLLRNEADDYEVRCVTDNAFAALVVCNLVGDSVCVEPWCGLPDSINKGRFVRWIAPGETERYEMRMEVKPLE